MEPIYRLVFNKLEYKVVSVTKDILEGVEKIFLLSNLYRVIMQLLAFSLVGLLTLASLFWFATPMSAGLANAMLVTFLGIFIPCSLILFVATRKRAISKSTGLDVQLKKIEGRPNLEEELIQIIIDFLSKKKQPNSDLERIKNIEKSLEAVAEALASIQEGQSNNQKNSLKDEDANSSAKSRDNNLIH